MTRGGIMDVAGHAPDGQRGRAGGSAPKLLLWNPAPRARGGVTVADVTLFRRDVLVGPPTEGRLPRQGPGYRPFALQGPDGRAIPVQILAQRVTQERTDAARHYPDQDEVDQVRIAFRAPPVPGLGLAALTAGAPVPLPPTEGAPVRGRAVEDRLVAGTLEPDGARTLLERRRKVRYGEL